MKTNPAALQHSSSKPLTKVRRGFTLLELLVVVTIIGILAVIGLVTYTNAQKNARDGRRKADITSIQKALELYYSDNNAYPANLAALNTGTTKYMPAGVPTDPRSTSATAVNYCYVTSTASCPAFTAGSAYAATTNSNTASYKLCAMQGSFEGATTPTADFCVQSQQG